MSVTPSAEREHGEVVEFCPKRDDQTHCNCWWDGKPCCACGSNEGHIDGVGDENNQS